MNSKTIKRVLGLLKHCRTAVAFSLIFALITAVIQLVIPIFCGKAIDAMLGFRNVDVSAVISAAVCVALAAVIGALAQHLLALCNNRITFSVCRELRDAIGGKINRLPISYLDSHPTGDTLSRISSDTDSFADGLLMGFTQLFTGIVTIVATLGIMIYLNRIITLAIVILTPLSIFTAKFITSKTHRFFEEQARIRGEQTAFINETVDGQRVIRAFGSETSSLETFEEINGRLTKAALNATFFSSLTNPSTRLVNNLVYAVVTLISAIFAVFGGITVGQLSIFLNYASQYAKPFNEISGVITELQNALTCVERVFEFLDEVEETPDPQPSENPVREGNVVLDNVSFSYTPDRKLIENLSLNVAPGSRIAVVGPTGCGKTTLINLLMRFYDVNGGGIYVDGADIRNMTRVNLRSRYGMVLQDTWLSSGTVRENIAYGKPDARDEEIENAAKAAHAHSFIRRLPDGYDTVLTENGSNLSAGQRQLLCIARAMLALPPMLILDEATSSIDTRTEHKIQKAFSEMMKGRTSFIVAHRLSTVRDADTILVMKDGHVIEQGSHSELLAKGGFYSELYNSQFAVA